MAAETLSILQTITGLGGIISWTTARTADGGGSRSPSIPKGFAGTLTTRTDNETGSLTLAGGHGITTGQIIDLYWSGGARYAVTVGTVSGNTVPIGADNSGTGSNLPIATTAIVASARVQVNCDIDGDNLSALALQLLSDSSTDTAYSHVTFQDASSDEIAALVLTANEVKMFDITGGDTNAFTGDPITKAYVSNGSSANDATFKLKWVQDSTP